MAVRMVMRWLPTLAALLLGTAALLLLLATRHRRASRKQRRSSSDDVHGSLDDALNRAVKALVARQLGAGRQCGVQVAAYLHSRLIVDVWAGHADAACTVPVTERTLFMGYSVTKARDTTDGGRAHHSSTRNS